MSEFVRPEFINGSMHILLPPRFYTPKDGLDIAAFEAFQIKTPTDLYTAFCLGFHSSRGGDSARQAVLSMILKLQDELNYETVTGYVYPQLLEVNRGLSQYFAKPLVEYVTTAKAEKGVVQKKEIPFIDYGNGEFALEVTVPISQPTTANNGVGTSYQGKSFTGDSLHMAVQTYCLQPSGAHNFVHRLFSTAKRYEGQSDSILNSLRYDLAKAFVGTPALR